MGAAVRCDDEQTLATLDGNILYRIGGFGGGIAIKGRNNVTNNILALPSAPSYRGMLSLEKAPVNGSIIQRNIFYAAGKGRKAVYQGRTYYKHDVWLKDCRADYNLYFHAGDPDWGRQHLQRERKNSIETHSVAADPMFVNVEKGDFRLKPGSPALKLGFKPIDMTKIGLLPEHPERRK